MSWLRYFLEKRSAIRQRKLEQLVCPHRFELVNKVKHYDGYMDDAYYKYDIYCPVCEKHEKSISQRDWNRLRNAQDYRNTYEKGEI